MKTKIRILTATNYTYLEPVNATHAKKEAAIWGSSSNYINFLIAKDRGDKASMQRSKDLQETFFTPAIARTSAERKGEGKKKKIKKTKSKKLVAAAKPGKKAASKKSPAKAAMKNVKPRKKMKLKVNHIKNLLKKISPTNSARA